jgi:thiamine biosynthesis lipoprotein
MITSRLVHEFASVSMDTLVHLQIVSPAAREAIQPHAQRALAWFDTVERICTRFDPTSEVMQLLHHVGEPVKVSTLLLEVAAFALELAEQTDGAFDPTIGATLEQLGYATNYRTGEVVHSHIEPGSGSFRDVRRQGIGHRPRRPGAGRLPRRMRRGWWRPVCARPQPKR